MSGDIERPEEVVAYVDRQNPWVRLYYDRTRATTETREGPKVPSPGQRPSWYFQLNLQGLPEQLHQLDDLVRKQGAPTDVARRVRQFTNLSQGLAADFGEWACVTVSPSILLTAVFGASVSVAEPLRLLNAMAKLDYVVRLAFLRNVFDVSSRVWGMGQLYDTLYKGRRTLEHRAVKPPAYLPATCPGTGPMAQPTTECEIRTSSQRPSSDCLPSVWLPRVCGPT